MADLSGTFRKPFAQQVASLRIRLANLVPTQAWDDMQRAQQDRAFVVAGAGQADLLADLGEAVRKSVEDGETFETFKRDFRAIVEKRGWHGWTGEGSLRGEEWRMRTIYRTNLRTSYMAGRHAQLTAGNFRYWIYKHSGAAHPRLDHLSWDGLTLSPDDPFWQTHYPPNGWGCGCKVRGANSARSVERLGGDLSMRKPEGWSGRDPRTGAPPGIDKLWDYAPGASVSEAVSALAPKLGTLPKPISTGLIEAMLSDAAFQRWFNAPVGNWPMARLGRADVDRLGVKSPIALLSPETLAKQIVRHPELGLAEYRAIQQIIDRPTLTLTDGPRNLIFLSENAGGSGYTLVVKAVVDNDEIFVTSFRRLSSDPAKRAREIARLKSKDV